MYKFLKRLLICTVIAALCWGWSVISDRKKLNETLIRFHVVANSDRPEDQMIKLKVRDAVLESIQSDLQRISDVELAKEYIYSSLSKIQNTANESLAALGVDQKAIVSFCREAFDVRHYDTFTLPAGVYNSLRIVIGDGSGKNWWCVSFPALCLPATSSEFEAVAVDAGLSKKLTDTLCCRENRQIRFYFLDRLGRLQNITFSGK